MKRHCAVGIAVLAVACCDGCTFQVETVKAAPVNVYSDYGSKIPGAWDIVIDPSVTFTREIKPSTVVCGVHSFPLASGSTIDESLRAMFQRIIEEPVFVTTAPAVADFPAAKIRGAAFVRLAGAQTELACHEGFWTTTCTGTVELTFVFEARGTGGPLMDTSVGAQKVVEKGAGNACEGGASALAEAYRISLKDSLERLAERIVNSGRMRQPEVAQSGDAR